MPDSAAQGGPGKVASLETSQSVFTDTEAAGSTAKPIWLATGPSWADDLSGLSVAEKSWLTSNDFKSASRKTVLLPAVDGGCGGVVLGAAQSRRAGVPPDPMSEPDALTGLLPPLLPGGVYRLASQPRSPDLAAVSWGLGAYRDRRYKTAPNGSVSRLVMPEGADGQRVRAIVDGAGFGRDLVNMPSNDLGPADLAAHAALLAEKHGARISVVKGDGLLAARCNLLHAVGRASEREPHLIDFAWGDTGPRITLVGKGICFDTGGLDLKPASGMLLMKKDMGGAAAVLALAHMIMASAMKVRLRVLIAAAENAVAGNAFRPGDVIVSRAGHTVEIGNTDAEGRLVLADALSIADEAEPDIIATFATLTGAARVAMGPEVSPFFCDDDALATRLATAGMSVCDPLWRMPFWSGYESMLDSTIADFNNVSESPFGGSIIAALFLRRFVAKAKRYVHFDIYGWRPQAKPMGPRGGEVQGARALFEVLTEEAGRKAH